MILAKKILIFVFVPCTAFKFCCLNSTLSNQLQKIIWIAS